MSCRSRAITDRWTKNHATNTATARLSSEIAEQPEAGIVERILGGGGGFRGHRFDAGNQRRDLGLHILGRFFEPELQHLGSGTLFEIGSSQRENAAGAGPQRQHRSGDLVDRLSFGPVKRRIGHHEIETAVEAVPDLVELLLARRHSLGLARGGCAIEDTH